MTGPGIKMRGGLSAHAAMLEMAQEAADQAAVNVLNILVKWLEQKGHPDLAREMLDTFAAEQTEESPADLPAATDPEAIQPAPGPAPATQDTLIEGEH